MRIGTEIARVTVTSSGTYALLSPTSHPVLPLDVGVFYPYLPDLQIVQVILLAGLTAAALGALGLPRGSGGPWSHRTAMVLAAAGVGAAGTAVAPAGSARMTANGADIPALHDASEDQPIPYTPACSHTAVPVCLHPAFRSYLPDMTAALDPRLRQVTGLPGAAVRVEQVADQRFAIRVVRNGLVPCFPTQGIDGATISGSPPVLHFFIDAVPGMLGLNTATFAKQVQLSFAQTVVGGSICRGNAAQEAVQAALLKTTSASLVTTRQAAGGLLGPSAPAYAAALRLAALPAVSRRAWLATHLAALRAGRLKIARLP